VRDFRLGARFLKELNRSDLFVSAHLHRISISINPLERTLDSAGERGR
jgi:hypothetical protein